MNHNTSCAAITKRGEYNVGINPTYYMIPIVAFTRDYVSKRTTIDQI